MIGEGHGAVRLTDVSGNTMQLDTSGRITIAGGSITASISGDTVIAKISGETVISNVSGNVVTAKVSGEFVSISGGSNGIIAVKLVSSGNGLALITGTGDSLSSANSLLYAGAHMLALRENGSGFARLRMTESGQTAPMSGVGWNLGVNFSGAVATVSGNTVNMAGAVVTAPTWVAITGASGGTTLASQACTMVRLMNLSGNGTMLVGGTGTAAPVSGTKGIMLWPGSLSVQGTEMDFPVNNANLLAVVAHTSGNTLAYMTFG